MHLELLHNIKVIFRKILNRNINIDTFYQKVNGENAGNDKIYELLSNDKPCMISRFGSTELSAIYFYYINFGRFRRIIWPRKYKIELNYQSGFFPANDKSVSKFCKLFISHLKNADLMGVWHKPGEALMISKFAPKAFLIPLHALEPYYFPNPWSYILNNKTVLVIHPFVDTINLQFQKYREKLFENKVLPNFKLITIKAIQSLGSSETEFLTWFEAYDFMCAEISTKNFDIAIIGAGAYGLPLASYVKNIGKKSVHLGGATQLLFGIKGKRWDDHPIISLLYNEFWVRPSKLETPKQENLLEDGCYW